MSHTTSASRPDVSLGIECCSHVVLLFARQERRRQCIFAVLDPFHGTAELQRSCGDGDLLASDDALLPEAAAHVGYDDAHLALVEPDTAR